MTSDLHAIAQTLHEAQQEAKATQQLEGDLEQADAYRIQKLILDKHTEAGEKYLGPKLGFTSKAKMEQMGVNHIIVGFLTDAMKHDPAQPLELSGLIHPRIEPELVFKLGPAVVPAEGESAEELAARLREATTSVAVGLEVIDSRYENFKFNLADVVADNTSAAKFVVGDWHPYPRELAALPVQFVIDGDVVEKADTNAILGNPEEAFVELAKMMLLYGIEVPEDAIILAGSMTPAQFLHAGQKVEAIVEGFDSISVGIA